MNKDIFADFIANHFNYCTFLGELPDELNLIKTNYSPSCQYLQGPATLKFLPLIHILRCTIVTNPVTTWIWINAFIEIIILYKKSKCIYAIKYIKTNKNKQR